MTRHYSDLASASDWLKQISQAARPIRSTTQISVATRHQYGISALVSQTSFRGETVSGVAKCRLFSQASKSSALFVLANGNRNYAIYTPGTISHDIFSHGLIEISVVLATALKIVRACSLLFIITLFRRSGSISFVYALVDSG